MRYKKKDVKKIKKATEEELGKLKEQYKEVAENVSGTSPLGLLAIAIVGIIVTLYFQNKFLVLVGLLMILCPLYVFIRRGAHREGYFEGYYELMTRLGSRDGHTDQKKSEEK
jgi:hypothetical protein